MTWTHIPPWLWCFTCGLGLAWTTNTYAAPPKSLQLARAKLNTLQSYHMHMKAIITPPPFKQGKKPIKMTASSELWGQTNKRFRNKLKRLSSARGIGVEVEILFDGTWQWAHLRTTLQKRVIRNVISKIKLARTTTSKRPFDTGYSLRGTGLYPGEDYVQSVHSLLTHYHQWKTKPIRKFKTIPCHVLKGRMNVPSMLAHLKQTQQRHTLTPRVLAGLKKRLKQVQLTLFIDAKSHILRGYRLYYPEDKASMDVTFSNIRWNPKLPPKTFVFTPPKNLPVRDITDTILRSRKAKAQRPKPTPRRPKVAPQKTQLNPSKLQPTVRSKRIGSKTR